MPYVTCVERIGISKGIQQGIQRGLDREQRLLSHKHFGAEVAERSAHLLSRIESAGTLADLAEALLDSARRTARLGSQP